MTKKTSEFANELGRHTALAIDTALLFREAKAANRYQKERKVITKFARAPMNLR